MYCYNFKINHLISGVLCALALLSNIADIIQSSEVIPRAFRLNTVFRQNGLTKVFARSQERGFNGVHFSPVPPTKLTSFNRDRFMQLYANSVHELGHEQEMVLDELNSRKCLMPDLMVRDLHDFDPESGGAPIPHILLDQANDVWRDTVHDCVYLCNDAIAAAFKFRYGDDRWTKYGRENGLFSESGYMYLVSPDDCSRSGIVDISMIPGLENYGK